METRKVNINLNGLNANFNRDSGMLSLAVPVLEVHYPMLGDGFVGQLEEVGLTENDVDEAAEAFMQVANDKLFIRMILNRKSK